MMLMSFEIAIYYPDFLKKMALPEYRSVIFRDNPNFGISAVRGRGLITPSYSILRIWMRRAKRRNWPTVSENRIGHNENNLLRRIEIMIFRSAVFLKLVNQFDTYLTGRRGTRPCHHRCLWDCTFFEELEDPFPEGILGIRILYTSSIHSCRYCLSFDFPSNGL